MLYQSPFTRRVILPKERPREARRLGLAISGLRRARKTAASNTQGKKRPMLYSYTLSCTLLISSCCVMWCAQKLISSFNRPALIVRVVTLHANILYHSCIDPSNVACDIQCDGGHVGERPLPCDHVAFSFHIRSKLELLGRSAVRGRRKVKVCAVGEHAHASGMRVRTLAAANDHYFADVHRTRECDFNEELLVRVAHQAWLHIQSPCEWFKNTSCVAWDSCVECLAAIDVLVKIPRVFRKLS
mmetsp:Transcript_6878/g.14122  ORF Transcript_6878/g.14122 Transcript_6878/m.14122 type:complete len:243 (-) Transcript_6878:76-804(-)